MGVSGLFVRHKVSDRASPDVAEGACNAIILEYALVVAVVSIGWSGYLQVLLGQFGLSLPRLHRRGPEGSVRFCGGEMALDVESVVSGCVG